MLHGFPIQTEWKKLMVKYQKICHPLSEEYDPRWLLFCDCVMRNSNRCHWHLNIDNQTFFQELEWLAALLVFKLAHQNPLYCVYSVVQQYFI